MLALTRVLLIALLHPLLPVRDDCSILFPLFIIKHFLDALIGIIGYFLESQLADIPVTDRRIPQLPHLLLPLPDDARHLRGLG